MFRRTLGILVACCAVVVTATPAGAGSPAAPPGASVTTAASAPVRSVAATATPTVTGRQRITLVTGERVTITTFSDGRSGLTITPVAGLEHQPMFRIELDGDQYVIPGYVSDLVPDRLDLDLFDVTALARDGYADDVSGELPLIVTYADGIAAPVRSIDVTRSLPVVDGAAALQPRGRAADLGLSLAARASDARAADPLAGVDKIWLDGRVHVALDESVNQIGAPVAWASGFDGSGVTVAVLDTGIDVGHPDLIGQIAGQRILAEGTSTPDDMLGHGTHVAGIIAGTGAHSDGLYRGVAPGARILNGKVLDDSGSGLDSWIIAGMEWAVASGADIVNLSLGGEPTDGTDPLSAAVDRLTADSGALFVIAAGNDGPGESTVGAPGAADSALTVGAVDGDDQLADFSSIGPRLGDFAIKPNVTAPGVDIASAEAEHGTIGEPVADGYVSLSGTSMATPHVAGAAALLAQAHPDWGSEQLRSALVSSAVPDPARTVHQRGAGRIDVARALDVPVLVSPASLDLGYFQYPQAADAGATRTVSYTNAGEADVVLSLDVAVRTPDGTIAESGMISLSTAELVVPAGGAASVDVTVAVAGGEPAVYGGELTATAGDGTVVSIPVGFYKEPIRRVLTIAATEFDGTPGFGELSALTVVRLDEPDTFATIEFPGDGSEFTIRVPPGEYSVLGFVGDGDTLVEVGDPEFTVAGDTTLVLDATRSVPVTFDVVGDPRLDTVTLGAERFTAERTAGAGIFAMAVSPGEARLVPSDTVTSGSMLHLARASLSSTTEDHIYDLFYTVMGRIPAEADYVADASNTATVVHRYRTHVVNTGYRHVSMPLIPGMNVAGAADFPLRAPGVHIVTGSAYDGVQWVHSSAVDDMDSFSDVLDSEIETYAPGTTSYETWHEQTAVPFVWDGAVTRAGDTLAITIPEWSDRAGHFGLQDVDVDGLIDRQRLELSTDAGSLGTAEGGLATFEVPAAPATYRLTFDTTRNASWWRLSTRVHTEWTFASAAADSDAEPMAIPLMSVHTDFVDDLRSRAIGRRVTFESHVHGTAEEEGVANRLRAFYSVDDGVTWVAWPTHATRVPGRFAATLPELASGTFVSVRVIASDRSGHQVRQDITRATVVR